MSREAAQPLQSPCYVAVFTSRRATAHDAAYQATAERMPLLAEAQDGFLGMDSVRNADGLGITVSYWRDLESIAAWKAQPEHVLAQRRGASEWYAQFELRIARVERAYAGP